MPVRVGRRVHSNPLLTRQVTTPSDHYLVTTRVHKADTIRSPVYQEEGVDDDHEDTAAPPHLPNNVRLLITRRRPGWLSAMSHA